MAENKRDDEMLAWLKSYPDMYKRLEQIRSLERSDPDLNRAELDLLELTQSVGASSFQRILQEKCDAASEEALKEPTMRKHGKKKLTYCCLFGVMEVQEAVLRIGTRTYRPACDHLRLSAYSYSVHLQRLIVDFAAEGSFESSSKRLKLHHRISTSASVIRKITLRHGQAMREEQQVEGVHGRLRANGAERIITEIDGSMVPIVECRPVKGGDRRKTRDCHWREARLCAARVHGENATVYGVNFGSVEQAGYTWAATVAKLPWAACTQLHALGDGAGWIAKQCEQCLGVDYLVDFYHVCEYLAAAAVRAATHPRWMQVQKNRLKNNRADKVIEALKPFIERENIPEEDAPVRAAIRYLENRIDQLDYQSAIENELPIGSGMIESGHRHVLQQRLKKAGAWWTHENAQRMAALRVLRANHTDDQYWKAAA